MLHPAFFLFHRRFLRSRVREKNSGKTADLSGKKYFCSIPVKFLTELFSVTKEENKITVVYDVTKYVLNGDLLITNFGLPTIHSAFRNANSDTSFGNIYLGVIFLN